MTNTIANTEALLNAAHIGRAVANLLEASNDQHTDAADMARTLAKKLADQSILLATPVVTVTGDTTPTLQQYLAADVTRGAIDHIIRSHVRSDGSVQFYIHPQGVDGDTPQFTLVGNQLTPL